MKIQATGRSCQWDGQEIVMVEPGSLEMDREASRGGVQPLGRRQVVQQDICAVDLGPQPGLVTQQGGYSEPVFSSVKWVYTMILDIPGS